MRTMFWNATAFNQNIGNWNTPSVTTMHRMFANTSNFNQDISSWNTTNVTDMYGVTSMGDMFYNATAFNQDLSGWCVSNISSEPTDFATGNRLDVITTSMGDLSLIIKNLLKKKSP